MGTFLARERQGECVIQLTLVDDGSRAWVARTAPFFRITGGNVWTSPGDGRIVRFTGQGWEFAGQVWDGMRFEGPSQLIMGLPKQPTAVSEVLKSVSIVRDVLSANGIPFAVYDPVRDMWRAVIAETWWHAFRIESVRDGRSASEPTVDPAGGPLKGAGQDLRQGAILH